MAAETAPNLSEARPAEAAQQVYVSYDFDQGPSVDQVVELLDALNQCRQVDDEDRAYLAEVLLCLGTRTDWRDAFFYGDIEGEVEPFDHIAFYANGGYLTALELAQVFRSFARRHEPTPAARRELLPALDSLGSRTEWAALLLSWED